MYSTTPSFQQASHCLSYSQQQEQISDTCPHGGQQGSIRGGLSEQTLLATMGHDLEPVSPSIA